MKWVIIELVATIIQCFISIDFVTKYLGWKRQKEVVKNYLGFGVAFLIETIATIFLNKITAFEGIAGLIYPTIVAVYCIFYLNGSIFEKIMIACMDNGLKMLSSVVVLTLISSITSVNVMDLIIYSGTERFLVMVFGISCYLFSTRMVLRLQKNNKFALSLKEWIAILGVFVTSFLAGVMVFQLLINSEESGKNDALAITIIGTLIMINALCYYIFVNISAKNRERIKYSLIELRLKEQEENLLSMKETHYEIQKIRHDMKNYLECAVILLHNEKSEEAKIYLSSLMKNKINFDTTIVSTKSDAVNAVISSKNSLCKKYKIEFHYEITGEVEKIPEIDISILLGNLLDNAIEACIHEIKTPLIHLSIYNKENYLVIIISNTIEESVLKKNPNLQTTKRDKLHHGIGNISVKDIVKKHNGMVQFYEKEDKFFVEVWIMLP